LPGINQPFCFSKLTFAWDTFADYFTFDLLVFVIEVFLSKFVCSWACFYYLTLTEYFNCSVSLFIPVVIIGESSLILSSCCVFYCPICSFIFSPFPALIFTSQGLLHIPFYFLCLLAIPCILVVLKIPVHILPAVTLSWFYMFPYLLWGPYNSISSFSRWFCYHIIYMCMHYKPYYILLSFCFM
jgi:hypothetical protein